MLPAVFNSSRQKKKKEARIARSPEDVSFQNSRSPELQERKLENIKYNYLDKLKDGRKHVSHRDEEKTNTGVTWETIGKLGELFLLPA